MSEESLSSRSRTVFGLVGAGVIAASAVFVAIGSTPSHAGSTYIDASFGRAGQGLDPGKSDVKIRGITVGAVDTVRLGRDGRVTVRMRLDKGVRIPDTTTAAVEPVSVFGPKDLALDLGANELNGPFLRDGAKVAKTRDPAELSDTAWLTYRLTKAINPDELTTLLHTFSAGLSGRGPALRRTIDNGTKVIDATHRDRQVIQTLLNDVTGLSGTFASRGDTAVGLARDLNRLGPVISDRPDKVSQLLDRSAELADRVGGTLQRQGGNIGEIVDSAGRITSVVAGQRRNVPVMLDSLNGFFSLLAQIIRIPGPEGTVIAQAREALPLDLCQIFIDACSPAPKKTAFDLKFDPDQPTPARRP
ncbi:MULTISPECIES: MlaD family protein [Thermomonosporaceae]|uniref:MlaD family protein n=1 Tax=Thermomonosporaceae TaxID=2012 RepID=UPI00255AF055|nr:MULTISPECIES: MlaD family protein [Thermomonosporaceae]MDL4775547.1 MlaD family protein [Actinomadura xylanilytica]